MSQSSPHSSPLLLLVFNIAEICPCPSSPYTTRHRPIPTLLLGPQSNLLCHYFIDNLAAPGTAL